MEHDQPTFLLHTALERLRWDHILRPGLTSLERIVSTARQQARQVTFERVSHLLTPEGKSLLNNLLERDQGGYRTTLSWLQRMPNDHTAPQSVATLERYAVLIPRQERDRAANRSAAAKEEGGTCAHASPSRIDDPIPSRTKHQLQKISASEVKGRVITFWW